jgi:hypothetical protein
MGYHTMGDVLGYDDVLGDDDYETVGARRALRRLPRAMLASPKPNWRGNRLAPGVQAPGEGLIPLPLVPDTAGGVFAAAVLAINFQARPQKPFHAERLLVSVRRTGAAGTIILCDTMFVGTDLQTAEIGSFDVEQFGPTAFGVRLSLKPAEPGILIRLACRANPAPGGADTVAVAMQFLGRYVG